MSYCAVSGSAVVPGRNAFVTYTGAGASVRAIDANIDAFVYIPVPNVAYSVQAPNQIVVECLGIATDACAEAISIYFGKTRVKEIRLPSEYEDFTRVFNALKPPLWGINVELQLKFANETDIFTVSSVGLNFVPFP